MRKKINKFVSHPLISGSTIIFAGSFITNLLNWFFNLSIGRNLLSVSDYGLYSSLISFLGLFGIFPASLITIFAKFTATYGPKGNKIMSINLLLRSSARIVLVLGAVIFLILLLVSFPIANFLQINDLKLIFLTALIVFLSIIYSPVGGILQGELRFVLISISNILSSFLKITICFSFLFLGFKVFGVLVGIFLSSLISFIVILIFIYKYYKNKETKINSIDKSIFYKEFKNYSYKFFLATIGITILTTTDVIFARHFFKPDMAGQYAALSIMGKSIFYFASPVYFVFFPLIASKKEKKEKLYETLFLGIGIITIISVALAFVYFLFPTVVLRIFFPAKEYSMLAPYLGPFSLYIIIFSIAILFNNFLLSIGKTGIYKINLLVAFLLIALMYIYNSNFYQVIGVLFVTSFLLMICQLAYYFMSIKKEYSQNEK